MCFQFASPIFPGAPKTCKTNTTERWKNYPFGYNQRATILNFVKFGYFNITFFIISPKKYTVLMFYSNFAIFFYKHTFFNTFLVEKIMRRKFDENLVKVSLKLSVGI